MQLIEGIPSSYQILLYSGKQLDNYSTLTTSGIQRDATLHLTSRLLGGKPVKVKMLTSHLPCGSEVTIDIESNATKEEIKQKLAPVTGVPIEHIKVMMSGINQIVMGDKRTNLGYSACGTTNGVQLAVEK